LYYITLFWKDKIIILGGVDLKKRIISFLIIIFTLFSNPNPLVSKDMVLSGESYILIEENSGRVLASQDEHKKMPIASTTKIMTALIALENGNLQDQIKINDDCIDIEGSSIYLERKEIINLKDLLYGLMLRSGNDAAIAISQNISNNQNEFIKMMNNKAKSINANNTNFTNPHGLNHDKHYSTAYDLALITKEAFKYQAFEEIVKTKSYTADRKNNNNFINKNKTLWEYEDGDGVKTGYTMKSGRCLVSSATKNNMRLIAVSLNAKNWFNDNYQLLDYGFENFTNHLIYDKNQFITSVDIKDGKEQLKVVTKQDFIYPLNSTEKKQIKFKITLDENITTPIYKGDVVGNINTYLNGVLIKKDELIGGNNVNKLNFIHNLLK